MNFRDASSMNACLHFIDDEEKSQVVFEPNKFIDLSRLSKEKLHNFLFQLKTGTNTIHPRILDPRYAVGAVFSGNNQTLGRVLGLTDELQEQFGDNSLREQIKGLLSIQEEGATIILAVKDDGAELQLPARRISDYLVIDSATYSSKRERDITERLLGQVVNYIGKELYLLISLDKGRSYKKIDSFIYEGRSALFAKKEAEFLACTFEELSSENQLSSRSIDIIRYAKDYGLGEKILATTLDQLTVQDRARFLLLLETLSSFQDVLFVSDNYFIMFSESERKKLEEKFISNNFNNYFCKLDIDRVVLSGSLDEKLTVAKKLGIHNPIVSLYLLTKQAMRLGLSAKDFDPRRSKYKCHKCREEINEQCAYCGGVGIEGPPLLVAFNELTIREVHNLKISEVLKLFKPFHEISIPCGSVVDSGFGYLPLKRTMKNCSSYEEKILYEANTSKK